MSHSPLNGRIIELWTEAGRLSFELMVGPKRIVLQGMKPEALPEDLRRGDLVSVQVTPTLEVLEIQKVGGCSRGDWSPLSDGMRWRRTVGGPSRIQRLRQRQDILQAIRESLRDQDFLEVETPLLVKGTCPDTEIESFCVRDPAGEVEGYLVTSTEYQLKRLMVGGIDRVFSLTQNFRAGDRGRFHSYEFTMLEWGRAFGDLDEIEEDAVRFIRKAFQKLYPTQTKVSYNGYEIDFMEAPWERLSVREAFKKYLGLENLVNFSLETLTTASRAAGIGVPLTF